MTGFLSGDQAFNRAKNRGLRLSADSINTAWFGVNACLHGPNFSNDLPLNR